jgi:hypothetical protein
MLYKLLACLLLASLCWLLAADWFSPYMCVCRAAAA